MATLLIRDIPEELDSELAALAEKNRRSKEKQALFLLQTGLRRVRTHAEVMQDVNRVSGQIKGKLSMTEILKHTEEAH